jgi:di/tricarboxylate transporter
MTLPIAVVLGILVLAVVLFSFERIPLEVSSLTVVALLGVTRILSPEQAFAGFANETVVFIFALLAMTQGLASTGVIQLLGQRLAVFGRFGPFLFVVVMMVVVATVSGFVSNTVTTATFLPVVIGAADRAKVPRSRALIPLAFAAMMGGTIFLIGTGTNLVVSGAMTAVGMAPIGFAEMAPVTAPLVALGVVVTAVLGHFLLPAHAATEDDDGGIPAREYLAEVIVPPGSRYAGKPLSEVTQGLGLRVLAVTRAGATLEAQPEVLLAPGDALLLEEDRVDILRVKDLRGLEMRADVDLPGDEGEGVVLAEATVPVGSSLVGRSLREAFFAEHFGLAALAICRRPAIQRLTRVQLLRGLFGGHSLSTLPLAAGDVLLLRGPRHRLRTLGDGQVLSLLGNVEYQPVRYGKAVIAVVLFVGALAGGILHLLPLAVSGLVGMLLMIVTRCVDARAAFRVEWRIVLLIGSMMALGTAMEVTGTGRLLGSLLVPLAGHVGARGVLGALLLLTALLSAPMSNEAAGLVMLPVATGVAAQLGIDPRPLAIGVCIAASWSFMLPLEPSCVLVYGPGRYKFSDFLKMGTPLTVVLLGLLSVLIPLRWPF